MLGVSYCEQMQIFCPSWVCWGQLLSAQGPREPQKAAAGFSRALGCAKNHGLAPRVPPRLREGGGSPWVQAGPFQAYSDWGACRRASPCPWECGSVVMRRHRVCVVRAVQAALGFGPSAGASLLEPPDGRARASHPGAVFLAAALLSAALIKMGLWLEHCAAGPSSCLLLSAAVSACRPRISSSLFFRRLAAVPR